MNESESEPVNLAGINATAVGQWLSQNISGSTPPFSYQMIEGGHSNLTYKVTDASDATLVLRRPPLHAVIATAHDMAREHRVISGVARAKVPVPVALGLCEDESINDAPFYIMNFVEGVVLHDEESVEASIPSLDVRHNVGTSTVDVLADLHRVDPSEVGLGDLGRTEAYLDRQLKRWRTQWEKTKTRELPAMEQAYATLVEAKPEQRYSGIVHGDYRLGNILVDPTTGSVTGVLDWELCTLGDPLADLGYLLNNWLQPGEDGYRGATSFPTQAGGFGSREEVVDRYCERTGFDRAHVTQTQNYYQAFQLWRLAAIVEGVLSRYLKGAMGDGTADTDAYVEQVSTMADASVELLKTL